MDVRGLEVRMDEYGYENTRATWIHQQMEEGHVDAVREHIMTVYYPPLVHYATALLKGRYARLAHRYDPEDIVGEFFSHRLESPEYVQRWVEHGRPLRHWLQEGLRLRFRDLVKPIDRARETPLGEEWDPAAADVDLEKQFDMEWGRSIVAKALAEAEAECRESGFSKHWEVFNEHHIAGKPYSECGGKYEVTPGRAEVMSRTARDRVRERVRALLRKECHTESEVDAQIAHLMELAR